MEQGFRQGCVLAPPLFNIFLTAAMRATEKRLLPDAAIMDNMAQLQREKEKGEKKGKPRAGKPDAWGGKEEEEAQQLWCMLYADNAGILSRSPGGLERMMTVIVNACSALRLTVPEVKAEITCLQTKGGRKV